MTGVAPAFAVIVITAAFLFVKVVADFVVAIVAVTRMDKIKALGACTKVSATEAVPGPGMLSAIDIIRLIGRRIGVWQPVMLSMLAPAHLANQVLDEIASAANYF